MRKISLYRYRLPIKTGVVLRKQVLSERMGLMVCLQENENIGWGEIAPLPLVSNETLEQAEVQTKKWLKLWKNGQEEALEMLFPSVAFGLSCALAELCNELEEQANYQSAILCYGEPEKMNQFFNRESFQLVKLKVGIDTEKDGKQANLLLETFPNLQLRLDANRMWSLEQAVRFSEKIANENKVRIQFIEEPCKTPELSREFTMQSGIAIAWDETVREPDFVVKKEQNLAAIVIKPTLVGSIQKCASLIQQSHSFGIEAVISSSLESSLGLTQLARMAQQYTPNSIPGLDTLNLMSTQLLRCWHNSPLPVAKLKDKFVSQIVL